MSWLLPIVWIVVGAALFFATRDMFNLGARYRVPAAIAVGVLWPVFATMLLAFLLADAIEWSMRWLVNRVDRP